MSSERCMCGDPYCPSCGPAQGYGPLYDDLEHEEDIDKEESLRDMADYLRAQAKEGVLPAPRCDLIVRTAHDAWEVGKTEDKK